jgi:hypothetical protein
MSGTCNHGFSKPGDALLHNRDAGQLSIVKLDARSQPCLAEEGCSWALLRSKVFSRSLKSGVWGLLTPRCSEGCNILNDTQWMPQRLFLLLLLPLCTTGP